MRLSPCSPLYKYLTQYEGLTPYTARTLRGSMEDFLHLSDEKRDVKIWHNFWYFYLPKVKIKVTSKSKTHPAPEKNLLNISALEKFISTGQTPSQ